MPRAPKLADRVAAKLRREILAGKWADRSLPSERELSETHRVARLTARRGLKRLCSEHLIEVRPGRGYVIAPGAAALQLQPQAHGHAVLFFFVDSSGRMALDPVDAGIMNGASAEARLRGVELYATCQEPAVFRRIVEERKGKDLRGVLLDWARRDLAEFLLEAGMPFVVVEDDLEGLPVTAVIQDNAAGTHAILEQMAAQGHRRIGLIVNSQQSVHPLQRLAAYREFMLRAGLGVSPELIAQDEPGTEGGRRAAARLLDRRRDWRDELPRAGLSAGLVAGHLGRARHRRAGRGRARRDLRGLGPARTRSGGHAGDRGAHPGRPPGADGVQDRVAAGGLRIGGSYCVGP